MDFRPQLVHHLATLTEALDVPGADLQAMLEVLLDDITVAVPSCTGLRISVDAGPIPTVLDVTLPGSATQASIQLHLPPAAEGAAGISLHLFADTVGAFTALAADARSAWGRSGQVTVDAHLADRPPDEVAEYQMASTTADAGVVQQAIGFLIDRGHPPWQAAAELHRQARARGMGIAERARELLADGGGRAG